MLFGFSAVPAGSAARSSTTAPSSTAQPSGPQAIYGCGWSGPNYACSGGDKATIALFTWVQHLISASIYKVYGNQGTAIPEDGQINASTAGGLSEVASAVGISYPSNQLDQIGWIVQNAQGLANTLQSFTGLTPPADVPTDTSQPVTIVTPSPDGGGGGGSSSSPTVYVCADGTYVTDMTMCAGMPPGIQPAAVTAAAAAAKKKKTYWAIGIGAAVLGVAGAVFFGHHGS